MNEKWKSILIYDKRERRGIISLSIVIIIGCLTLYAMPYFIRPDLEPSKNLEDLLFELEVPLEVQEKAIKTNWPKSKKKYKPFPKKEKYKKPRKVKTSKPIYPPIAPFDFDPNTVSKADLKKMKLAPFLAERIDNYRNKGGRFYKNEDIQKIYGMTDSIYAILQPYIKIKPTQKLDKPKEALATIRFYDINSATADELKSLKGIGDVLSKRIIKFRDALGGFHQISQLKETYGLADSTYKHIEQFLTVQAPIKRINVNTVDIDTLKKHQYIRYKLAKIIINYRHQHGEFTSLEELKNIKILDSEDYDKISPYLSVN